MLLVEKSLCVCGWKNEKKNILFFNGRPRNLIHWRFPPPVTLDCCLFAHDKNILTVVKFSSHVNMGEKTAFSVNNGLHEYFFVIVLKKCVCVREFLMSRECNDGWIVIFKHLIIQLTQKIILTLKFYHLKKVWTLMIHFCSIDWWAIRNSHTKT